MKKQQVNEISNKITKIQNKIWKFLFIKLYKMMLPAYQNAYV